MHAVHRPHLQRQSRTRRTPAGLRHGLPDESPIFGDLGDPTSAVSDLVAARGGTDLMPELGYRPVNKYLPPRRGRMAPTPLTALLDEGGADRDGGNRLLRWVDRLLSR